MTRLRPAVLLLLLVLVGLLAAGCGGSDEKTSSSTDVNALLTQTFTGSKDVESGNLALTMKLEETGGDTDRAEKLFEQRTNEDRPDSLPTEERRT